ncbi:MAG: hypothetical protein ACRYG6_05570 [Janthinobacterium lividum]
MPLSDDAPFVDIPLAAGAGRRDILGEGWCEAERDGTWTGDSEARLHLPLPPGPGACVLRLDAAPYRVAHKLGAQRVLVLANGRLLGRLRLDAPGEASLAIPAEAARGRRVLSLTLLLPDARRPFELGDSDDRRLLALFVRRVALLPPGPDGPDAAATGPAPADRALLDGFESLGWNEEFGFVQRRVLAEPAGLLRWSSWPLGAAVLAEALDAALFGVGDPDQLAVAAEADSWVATDRRWGLRTDTQVPVHAIVADALRAREAAAREMLRARLLSTLREGRRILVHLERDPAERDAADALAAAAAAWGGCPLLWVSQGPEAAVRRRGGLLEATLPQLAPPGNLARVAEEDWVAVCREAWRLAGGRQA